MKILTDKVLTRLLFVFAVMAIYFLASAFYIPAKALFAQNLLHSAWDSTIAGNDQVKPWPWADTWPVARLRIPALKVDQIILDGDQGSSLAFAPGRRVHHYTDKRSGLIMISAHRDTHFKFLQHVSLGQMIELQNELGDISQYKIEDMQIVDSRTMGVLAPEQGQWLTLVTCYPFNAIDNRSSLRYVVFAEKIKLCADADDSCQV